jgi:transcriptional regulator with PAS, ATPase and Fis domain
MVVGLEKGLKEIYQNVLDVSKFNINLLITGETGTGKEVVARLVHELSGRTGPLVTVNCSAIPEALLESELFGYEKGAFTGADKAKKGKIECADFGTLFLDEIGDMNLGLQAKLLRAIQEKEFEPVGGNVKKKIDFRVIAATNNDLPKAIAKKQFREDLYYRLNGMSIALPSLRERKDDIEDFVTFFARKVNKEHGVPLKIFSADAIDFLKSREWPGNVREFQNFITRVCVLNHETYISQESLIKFMGAAHMKDIDYEHNKALESLCTSVINKKISIDDIENLIINKILQFYNYNIPLAVFNTAIKKDRFYRRQIKENQQCIPA